MNRVSLTPADDEKRLFSAANRGYLAELPEVLKTLVLPGFLLVFGSDSRQSEDRYSIQLSYGRVRRPTAQLTANLVAGKMLPGQLAPANCQCQGNATQT